MDWRPLTIRMFSVAAGLNFGFWQDSIFAGVFIIMLLLLICQFVEILNG